MGGWKWNQTLFDVKTFKVRGRGLHAQCLQSQKTRWNTSCESDLHGPCTSWPCFSVTFCHSHDFGWLFLKSSHPSPICLNNTKENKKLSPGLCWCTFLGRSRTERSTRWSPPSTRTRTGRSATQSLEWVSAACGRKQCIKGSFEQCYLLLTVFTFAITIDIKIIAPTEAIQTWKMSNILPR